MPPKKKKKGKKEGKKKGKGDDKGKGSDPQKAYEPPGASEKELALRKELDEVDFELTTLKKQVNDLRQENEWLQKEAEETRQETQDYQTYISRKAEKRQSLIVSLSDHNQQQLKMIAKEREELLRDYEEKKARLNGILLEKENELSKIQQELKLLEPFKALQAEQEKEMEILEHKMEEERFAHEDKIRAIKTQFLKEKRVLEEASETRIKEIADLTKKQASVCLAQHTKQIQVENRELRQNLQELIDVTTSLQLQKRRLEKQYSGLLREHQFSQNLQQLRGSVFRGPRTSTDLELGGDEQHTSEIGLPEIKHRL